MNVEPFGPIPLGAEVWRRGSCSVSSLSQIDLYFPPEFLKAALIVALLSVWTLVGICSYLNRHTRKRYFTIWTTAWLFYALWLTLAIRFHSGGRAPWSPCCSSGVLALPRCS